MFRAVERMADIEEKPKYMGVPYIKDNILYNFCDCGSYQALTRTIIKNGYRCPKCGKRWIAFWIF